MRPEREDRASELWDLLADAPQGLTMDQMMTALEVDERVVDQSIQDIRLLFADDEINLVCDPRGARERWVYRLVGRYEDASPWLTNQSAHNESRVRTMKAVAQSMVNGADGRTIEGKKARLKLKYFSRLLEDLEELSEVE